MLSKLKLSLMENPTVEYVISNIDDFDTARIKKWYAINAPLPENNDVSIEKAVALLIWCNTDGQYAADTQNPARFLEALGFASRKFGLPTKAIQALFYSHQTLLTMQQEEYSLPEGKPFFIVIEGLDGSGKSKQIDLLKEKMHLAGRKVCVTAEPTNSVTGGIIRDSLSNNYVREASELASLFLADRISHNVNPTWGIKKLLAEGLDVLCDRYYYSSFAYQSIGSDMDWIIDMNRNCPQIMRPDLCIFLDADPQKCKTRVDGAERTHVEIYENDENIMAKTREQFFKVFRKLNDSENIKIVDANRPINVVSDEIYRIVMQLK